MNKLERYSSLCSLIKEISDKKEEVVRLKHQASKVQYDINVLNEKIEEYSDVSYMSGKDIENQKSMLMRDCLNVVSSYGDGGTISVIDMGMFKDTMEYQSSEPEVKSLFEKSEIPLSAYEESLSNAILIGQDDNDDFDVYQSGVIEDFIDDIMINTDGYETARYKHLKELKKLMYKFVEQVSNN